MIIDIMNKVIYLKHAVKSMQHALIAYDETTSPYTRQVVYSMAVYIEEQCRAIRRMLDGENQR